MPGLRFDIVPVGHPGLLSIGSNYLVVVCMLQLLLPKRRVITMPGAKGYFDSEPRCLPMNRAGSLGSAVLLSGVVVASSCIGFIFQYL